MAVHYRGLNKLISPNTILVVPYYNYKYSIPQNPILIIKAPTVGVAVLHLERPRVPVARCCPSGSDQGTGFRVSGFRV